MPLIVRKGDSISHGGSVVGSAAKRMCEGKLIARKGDQVVCNLHGAQTITGGSAKRTCEGQPIARNGDGVSCGATLISGATKWSCD